MLHVYTDGSCVRNPGGPGGWAWVVDERTYDFGGVASTTSQRMEIQAAYEAVQSLKGTPLRIHTDSKYVMNCATRVWKIKKNQDLWEPFLALLDVRIVQFVWVKSHSGVRLNEVADRLAAKGRLGERPGVQEKVS